MISSQFIIHLRYANSPVLVTLRSALHSVMSHQIRFIVRGREASYVKYGLDVQGTVITGRYMNGGLYILAEPQIMTQGMSPLDPGFGEEPEANWGEFGERGSDGKTTFSK
jgi:hypothetical protein